MKLYPVSSHALPDPELADAAQALANAPLDEVLRWLDARFGADAALASSFSAEDVVLIHAAQSAAPKMRIFTLDTGRLPPETHELMEVLRHRFGVKVETYFPDAPALERLTREQGHFSFRQSVEARHACCEIRKVEPLRRALADKGAWVTGLRREQSPTRTGVMVLERDVVHGGIAKLNPLAAWSETQVWEYLTALRLPYNALYDRGYRSIGCAPCTRSLKPWEDVRAGRWWWESPEHKECGIHVSR